MGVIAEPVVGSGSWPAWIARVSKSIDSAYCQPQGAGEPCRGAREGLVEPAAHARLRREPLDLQHAASAVGLEIGPPDEAVADEERQHVVAVHALVRALVDLDQVLEAEEAAKKAAVPHQVVERRDENGGRRSAVERRVRHDEDRRAAVVELDAAQAALAYERLDVRPDALRAAGEAAVLGDPGPGQRAAAFDGPQRIGAAKLVLGRDRRAEVAVRDHPLRKVVEALEALSPCDRELAGREQVLERALLRLPAPHRAAAALERA